MKSLPLQTQQNLILAATLIGGILFAPHNIEKPLTDLQVMYFRPARAEASYGTASSLLKRPASLLENAAKAMVPQAPVSNAMLRGGNPANGEIKKQWTGTDHRVPKELQGVWHWDSRHTENTAAPKPARGVSEGTVSSSVFTFRPDGRYSYGYAVRQRLQGRAVESTTTEEGTVSFHNDGSFVMEPEQGRFQGNTGDGLVNRPMDEAELGKRTFHWGWRGEPGKQKLFLGPSEKSASIYTSFSASSPASQV